MSLHQASLETVSKAALSFTIFLGPLRGRHMERRSSFLFHQDRSSCRFFYPWPYQPYQVYDANSERVALQRRLPEDDAWVVPHNLALTMFSPSSVNVICFDPMRGFVVCKQCYAERGRGPTLTQLGCS